jgi:hypothetical protein
MKLKLISATLFVCAIAFVFARTSDGSAQAAPIVVRTVPASSDTPIDWEKMSRSEKKQYMKDVVMPKMKKVMHDFDPKRFKDVKCSTCHRKGAGDATYKMPDPKLPKLPATKEGFDKLQKKQPKMMGFMSKTMKPEMAALLGMKPFDPKVGSGFGCGNCHTNKKK